MALIARFARPDPGTAALAWAQSLWLGHGRSGLGTVALAWARSLGFFYY